MLVTSPAECAGLIVNVTFSVALATHLTEANMERDYRLLNDIDPDLDTRGYGDDAEMDRRLNREGFEAFAEEWQGYMEEWQDNF
jgi:hypothetical protein